MSEEIESDPTQFESLVGRFFDGELTDAEDRELVAMLEADPTLAKRFVEMARLDRALAAIASQHRVSDAAFDAAVRKGLELSEEGESREFAAVVVQMVRDGSDRRRTRRLASAQQERRAGQFSAAAIAAIACVTVAALALLFFSRTEAPVASVPNKVTAPADIVAAAPNENVPPLGAAKPEVAPAKQNPRRNTLAAAPPRNATPPGTMPIWSTETGIPEVIPPDSQEGVRETAAIDDPVTPDMPGNFAEEGAVASSPANNSALEKVAGLAKVARLTNVTAAVQRNGKRVDATGPMLEGDVLRISALDSSPGEAAPAKFVAGATPGADVMLSDGSRLWLSAGSEFRFHVENQSICPTLDAGEVVAHIKPQPAGHPLKIRTQQGPVVEVVGTVFTLSAETAKKRVSLRVDEGKVLFTAQSVERKVTADEMCDAEDGRAPGQIVRVKSSLAAAFGVVLDKATGKPFENAVLFAVPQAKRKSDVRSIAVKADAQGKFRFDALREGNYFIVAQPDNLNGAAQVRFALARARLKAGEEIQVNLLADKPAVVVGAVEESGKRLLMTNYRVRFLAEGGDGLTVHPILVSDNSRETDYHCAVIEGSGKYVPIVEKPGLLIKIRTPQRVQLLNDRLNQWVLDVQTSPSASIKGRVIDAATNTALGDESGADANDPRSPRTTITLTPSSGLSYVAAAESDGTVFFNTNLDTGTYELKVQRFGFAPFTKRVNLTAGQALELDLPLERAKK